MVVPTVRRVDHRRLGTGCRTASDHLDHISSAQNCSIWSDVTKYLIDLSAGGDTILTMPPAKVGLAYEVLLGDMGTKDFIILTQADGIILFGKGTGVTLLCAAFCGRERSCSSLWYRLKCLFTNLLSRRHSALLTASVILVLLGIRKRATVSLFYNPQRT